MGARSQYQTFALHGNGTAATAFQLSLIPVKVSAGEGLLALLLALPLPHRTPGTLSHTRWLGTGVVRSVAVADSYPTAPLVHYNLD